MRELKASKPQMARREAPPTTPIVKTTVVKTKDQPVLIQCEGTVRPLREINIIPQVGGKVIYVSPNLVDGGVFKKGDVLLRVDPVDYKLAVTLAKAKVESAESVLRMTEEEAAAARDEWLLIEGNKSGGRKSPPSLVAKEPQLDAAKAALEADRANLRMARLSLDRTVLKAPFDGRISKENVDVGQFVSPGQSLGTLYSTEAAEIVVPLENQDLFWIHVPGFTPGQGPGSEAIVKVLFGAQEMTWRGRVVRASGKLDERTRMFEVIVRVEDPYAKKPPLAPGLFVRIDIRGRVLKNVVFIPRSHLHDGNVCWVLDDEDCLHFRKVEVARFIGENALVQHGVEDGERLVTSPLMTVTDGMAVRTMSSKEKTAQTTSRGPGGPMPDPNQFVLTLRDRLSLTEEQTERIRPIIASQFAEQRKIFMKYFGKGPLSMRSMGNKMQELSEWTTKKLEPIFSEEQMKEYLVFQQEMRERMGQGPPMGRPPS
jgi:RND family efflux transporter MFP subunit